MSIWGQMNHTNGQALADSLCAYRPFVGRIVRVTDNRAHKGRIGKVTWHGRDRFVSFRYGGPDAAALCEVMGRYGYRIRVQPDDGTLPFFVSADAVMVCVS